MFCTLHGKCKQAFTLMAVAVQTDDFNAMDQTTDSDLTHMGEDVWTLATSSKLSTGI